MNAVSNVGIGSIRPAADPTTTVHASRPLDGYAKHVGRVGALAVALGVGFAIASGATGVARAESDTAASETSSASDAASSDPGPAASSSTSDEDDSDDAQQEDEEDPTEDDEDEPEVDVPSEASDDDSDRPVAVDPEPAELDDEDSEEPTGGESVDVDDSTPQRPEVEPLVHAPVAEADASVSAPELTAVPAAVTDRIALATLDAPQAPAQPTIWAILGQLISDLQRTWFNRRPDVDYQQVDVTLDEVDDISDPIAFGGVDPDGDELTYWTPRRGSWFGPRHGTVTIDQATGTFTYNADDAFAVSGGRDTFLVRVTDYAPGEFHLHTLFGGHSDYALVTVVVAPTNRPPVAGDDTVNVDEDGLLNVNPADLLNNDTDADADTLTIEGYTQPDHGDLWINRDGTISYNPDDDYHGTDTFTYTLTDGTQTTTATVTVNIKPINDLPVAGDDTVNVDEDGLLNVNPADLLNNDTDADADTLTIEGYTQPDHGDLWINRDGTISYNPDDDYHGTDTFTYTLTDGTQTTTATVTVNVAAVPDGPTANDDALSATEDQPSTFNPIALLGNDKSSNGAPLDADGDGVPDSPGVTIDMFSQPANGTLVRNPNGTFTYTPDANFNGIDTFSYTILEDGMASVAATVTITVAPVADLPGVPTVDVGEPNPVTGVVGGSVIGTDPDGDAITYSAPTRAAHGTVTIDPNTGEFTYTPDEEARDALSGSVSAGTVTLSDPAAVTQGTFDASGAASTGDYNYIATFFTATETQQYIFGQSSAPVDTMIYLYNGTFDPTSPLTNRIAANDDAWLPDHVAAGQPSVSCGGSNGLCPQVSANLDAGQLVTIVVTTFSEGDPLGLPQSFYTTGPGRFTTISPEDSFVVTMSDGNGGTTDVTVRVPIVPLDTAIEA